MYVNTLVRFPVSKFVVIYQCGKMNGANGQNHGLILLSTGISPWSKQLISIVHQVIRI